MLNVVHMANICTILVQLKIKTTCKYAKNTLQTVKWHRILQYVVPEHANNTYGEVEA